MGSCTSLVLAVPRLRPDRRVLEQVGEPMRRPRHLELVNAAAELDDHALLARLREPACVTEFVRRHQSRLLRLASAMLNNRADAEEVVQDTFLQAFRAADGFRGDAQVTTWLHTICYRQVLSRRRRRYLPTVGDEQLASRAAAQQDTVTAMALAAAIEELPDVNREAFVLVDVLGFSRADAAEITRTEANTMRARVARARLLLADLLEPATEGDQIR